MHSPDNFPAIPPKLLEALEAHFPSRDPILTDTHDKLMFHGGQRDVLRFLRRMAEGQAQSLMRSSHV